MLTLAFLVVAFAATPHDLEDARIESPSLYEAEGGVAVSVTGRVFAPDGTPAFGARVTVSGRFPSRASGTRIQGETTAYDDGRFTLTGLNFTDSDARVDIVGVDGETAVTHRVPVATAGTVDLGDIRLKPDAGRVRRRPDAPVELGGRVTSLEGVPLAGLRVRAGWIESGATSITDEDGRFSLRVRTFEPTRLWIDAGHSEVAIWFEAQTANEERIVVPPGPDMEIAIPTWPLDLRRRAPADTAWPELRYAIARDGRWTEVDRDVAAVRLEDVRAGFLIRADGHLPRVEHAEKAWHGLSIDLQAETLRTLAVVDAGDPVVTARVFLAQVDPRRPRVRAQSLGELEPDAEGRFRGLAPSDLHCLATVVAEGYAPATVHWKRSGTTTVALARTSADVTLRGVGANETLLLGPAGEDRIVHSWWRRAPDAGGPRVRLAPGRYDVLLLSADGQPLAGQTFAITEEDGRIDLDVREDLRLRAKLQLPALPMAMMEEREVPSEWLVGASRAMPAGGAMGAAVITTFRSEESLEWPAAQASRPNPRQREIVFNGSGRYLVHVTDAFGGLGFSLFREVTVGARQRRLELPALACVLEGAMPDFDADVRRLSHHGVAGPRLLLLAETPGDEDLDWSVMAHAPSRIEGSKHGFRLQRLPAGRYLLQDHLRETLSSFPGSGVWGGWRIRLAPDAPTDVSDLERGTQRSAGLRVTRADGTPVTDAVVSVVDPLSDAWWAFARLPTTGSLAMYPLPGRFALRLDDDGRCRLPRVWRDAIVLECTIDDGPRVTATLAIPDDFDETIVWTLPEGI
ncbi:MAG: carboxypeptidase-like regulatory domain-containing protein [Planctomycetota bacterium]